MNDLRRARGVKQRHLWWLLVHGLPSRGSRQRHHPGRQPGAQAEPRARRDCARGSACLRWRACVGRCQFGEPDELPRIKSRAAYERGRNTPPDWRIACCYVGKGHRRQSVATAALVGALDLIAGLGGGTVEGYPEDAGAVPAGFLDNGALSTYESLGFTRHRKIGKHRWGRHEGRRVLSDDHVTGVIEQCRFRSSTPLRSWPPRCRGQRRPSARPDRWWSRPSESGKIGDEPVGQTQRGGRRMADRGSSTGPVGPRGGPDA